jgi:hypothetical protein
LLDASVQDVSDGAGLADLGGVEFSEDVPFGDVEAVHAGVESDAGEPEFDLVARKLAVLGPGAVGAELLQIDFNDISGV